MCFLTYSFKNINKIYKRQLLFITIFHARKHNAVQFGEYAYLSEHLFLFDQNVYLCNRSKFDKKKNHKKN